MEILKHGNQHDEPKPWRGVEITCPECGCVFKLTNDDEPDLEIANGYDRPGHPSGAIFYCPECAACNSLTLVWPENAEPPLPWDATFDPVEVAKGLPLWPA